MSKSSCIIDPADLRFRATIYENTSDDNTAQGQRVAEWTERAERWCSLAQVRAGQEWKYDQQTPSETYILMMRWDDVTKLIRAGWQIKCRGKTLNVTRVNNIEERDIAIEITAQRAQGEM